MESRLVAASHSGLVAASHSGLVAASRSGSASMPGNKVAVLLFVKDPMIRSDAEQFLLSETLMDCVKINLLPNVSNVNDASEIIKKQRAQKEPVMLLVVDLDLLHHKKYQEANQNEELPSEHDEKIAKFYELLRNYASTSWFVVGHSSTVKERKKKMKDLKKDLEDLFHHEASADMILSKPWVPGQMEGLIKKALEKRGRALEQSGIQPTQRL